MRHNLAHRRLGRTTKHRQALFRNMLSALINCDRIETTLIKAKELQPVADRLITLAKNGKLPSRRIAHSMLRDESALKKLFSTFAERYRARNGGYTRVLKLGFRHGDTADMAILEYLSADAKHDVKAAESKKTAKPKKETVKKTKKADKAEKAEV